MSDSKSALPAPSLVIQLDPPIEWNGGTYDAIELREPRAGEMIKAQLDGALPTGSNALKWGMTLIGLISGKPRQVVEQIPISKLLEGIEYLSGFMNVGQETGES